MPLIISTDPGATVKWGIGNRAEGTYDEHPGILLRTPELGIDDRGRQGLVALVMLFRPLTLGGEPQLQPARILERFIDDRVSPPIVGLDVDADGKVLSVGQLMAAYGAQKQSFFTDNAPTINAEAPVEGAEAEKVDLPF